MRPPSGARDRAATKALTTTHGATVTRGFFGLHAPRLGTDYPAAPVGALDLTTNMVYWPDLETSAGVFDFTRLDPMVEQAEANHAKPLIVLGQTPGFHSLDPSAVPVWATVPAMDAWKAYVTQVVTRYGSRLEYQIWPEPNVHNNFAGTPQQMADLLVAAAKIIHRIAPGATVVAPAMVLRLAFQRTWMKAFFAARVNGVRVGRFVDAVSVDPYPLQDGTPEDSLALITKAQRILAAADVTAPLWNLEINYFVPVGGVTSAAPSQRPHLGVVRDPYLRPQCRGRRPARLLARLAAVLQPGDLDGRRGRRHPDSSRARLLTRPYLAARPTCAWLHLRRRVRRLRLSLRARRPLQLGLLGAGRLRQVRAPAGVRHVQTMYGDISRTRRGERIRVTNAPVRVYH